MNSLNVSTLGSRNSKTLLKIDAITRGRHEVLFMSDCRLNNGTDDIARLMGLNKNASYKIYVNSSLDSRGVAIAIKKSVYHEVLDFTQ